jgi:hypothetical protein
MTQQIIHALQAGASNAELDGNPDINEAAYFCAEDAFELDNVVLRVDGIGPLALPLTRESIARLQAVALPAQFGLREQTLLDKRVRDTHEISADKLHVEVDADVMVDILANACATMGLPPDARLVPHLHNLLIYGPGQFFKSHQDSEKLPGMVATLVIVLPAPHIGGQLRIAHNGAEHWFESENLDAQDLKCIVFYADCEHEIRKVKQGYRVSLTYNLVLESASDLAATLAGQLDNPLLAAALRDYFAAPDADPSDSTAKPRLRRLACFLEHSYSEHGLRWDLLKGADHQAGRALCLAAQQLDLVPHLALVEIHQCWSAEGDEDDPDPQDLIDSEINLTYWVDLQNCPASLQACDLREEETCWLSELDEDDYFNSEYEGWTGNAGQTIDYWYRRAALVLWPRGADVAMQFMYNNSTALAGLLALTRQPGNEAAVEAGLGEAGSYLHGFRWDAPVANQLDALMRIACYVKHPGLALHCLRPFSIADLGQAAITGLLQLFGTYGGAWCLQLLAVWRDNAANVRLDQIRAQAGPEAGIARLVRDLLAGAADGDKAQVRALAVFLLDHYLATRIARDRGDMDQPPGQRREGNPNRLGQLAHLIHACLILADQVLSERLAGHVIAHPALYDAPDLADMVLALPRAEPGLPLPAFVTLRNHVATALQQEQAQGLRAADDWAMQPELRCRCPYCTPVADFVRSAGEVTRIWPLAAQNRDHVMRHFAKLGLPLDFEVRRQGSPHKLVVSKNPRLHRDAQARYERVQALAGQFGTAAR